MGVEGDLRLGKGRSTAGKEKKIGERGTHEENRIEREKEDKAEQKGRGTTDLNKQWVGSRFNCALRGNQYILCYFYNNPFFKLMSVSCF